MINLQDFISEDPHYKKFEVDELLFAEFKCPLSEEDTDLWWHNNFFAYVITGESIIKTLKREYLIKAGDCVFAKKGSVTTRGHSDADFCELIVFIPDSFIKTVIQKYKISLSGNGSPHQSDNVIPLGSDKLLDAYFHSLFTYFAQPEPPEDKLLKLKFEELLVSVVTNNRYSSSIQSYFREVCSTEKPSVKQVMEANFHQNLSLDEFARLCARSLTSFKQEFKNIYNTSPGKWLLKKRLEYSKFLLETTDKSIYEICDASGFENRSHFTRAFKKKYELSPGRYKGQMITK